MKPISFIRGSSWWCPMWFFARLLEIHTPSLHLRPTGSAQGWVVKQLKRQAEGQHLGIISHLTPWGWSAVCRSPEFSCFYLRMSYQSRHSVLISWTLWEDVSVSHTVTTGVMLAALLQIRSALVIFIAVIKRHDHASYRRQDLCLGYSSRGLRSIMEGATSSRHVSWSWEPRVAGSYLQPQTGSRESLLGIVSETSNPVSVTQFLQ